jgi:hypothetical protein
MPARFPVMPVNAMPSKATEFLAEELGVDPVRLALLAEIVPWALGVSDPVVALRAQSPGSDALVARSLAPRPEGCSPAGVA